MKDIGHTKTSEAYKLDCVVMASGYSKRFGSNKLLQPWGERSVFETILDSIPFDDLNEVVVVTRYQEVAKLCEGYDVRVVLHDMEYQSDTIRLGLDALSEHNATMFLTCDQPLRTKSSLKEMIQVSSMHPDAFVQLAYGERKGNPIIFPSKYDSQLSLLEKEQTGKNVVSTCREKLMLVQALSEYELCDIDTKEHYEELVQKIR